VCQSRRKHCIVAYFRRVLPVFSDFLDRRTRRRSVLELFGIASPIFRVVKVRTGVPLPAQARRSLADFSLVIGQHEFRVVPLLRTTFSGELKKTAKFTLLSKLSFSCSSPLDDTSMPHDASNVGLRKSSAPCPNAQCGPFFSQCPFSSVSWMHAAV
jgi:hypothetical protein